MSLPIERYLAVDLHKHYLVVGGVNAHQEVVLPPRRVELRAWPAWAQANLRPSDSLVVEATTNTWEFYDQSVSLVERLLVADPRKVAWIAQTRVKTNPLDVMKLARLSAANLIPEVWVPPRAVRELRAFLTHRRQLVKTQTTLKNRLHSLLHSCHLTPPGGDPFLPAQRAWWEGLSLSLTQQLHVRHDLAGLDQLAAQLAEVDAELYRLSCVAPWSDEVPYLLQLPGIGLLTAMTLLAAIGDVRRFPSAKKLVGYSGLGAGVYDTGQTHRTGHITKEGRRELRSVLVEAAWRTVESSDFWRAEFQRLGRRMHSHKAIVAIARQLLVVIWHVWTAHATDRQANPDKVAFKLMTWSWKLTDEQRGGLTTRQFVRYQLMHLGLGHDLTHVVRGGARRLIASPQEVLALKPEVQAA